MGDTADTAQVVIRPPLAWGLAVIAGLAPNWLVPLPFLPANLPAGWFGAIVFVLALALFAWAIVTIVRAGSHVPTHLPTTTIVESGPYSFTRNPIADASSIWRQLSIRTRREQYATGLGAYCAVITRWAYA
jgi:protein-S-isoprenylcysteine O-methyltransferase Ste14